METNSGAGPFLRRTLLRTAAAALLLACAVPGLARDDDADFAMRLADRGYETLANSVIDRMVASNKTPEGRGYAEFARCALLRRAALLAAGNDRSEPTEVREKFAAASRSYESFLKSNAGHPKAADGEYDLAKIKTDFAYYLTKNIEKFPAKDQDPVKAEAQKLFEDAIRYLTSIKEREHAKGEKLDPEDQDRFLQRNIAWYFLCGAMTDRAMLHPKGDALRIQQFTQAIDETILFLEETDGTIFGYFASLQLGLQYWHRGELKDGFSAEDIKSATEWFDVNVAAAEIPNLDQEWPPLARCVLQSCFSWGEMCNAVGSLEGVNYRKNFVDRMTMVEARLASCRTERFGLMALVQKGIALSGLGKHAAAVELLNQVSDMAGKVTDAWGRGADQLAKKALNDVVSAIPPDAGVQLSPAILFKAAEGSIRGGEYGRAIRVYQRVLAAVAEEPDAARRRALFDEFSTRCWLKINECYVRLDRHLEAFFAADYPVQEYLRTGRKDEDQEIDDLAYYRMTALRSLMQSVPADRKAAVQKELEDAQKFFTEKFADWSDKGTATTYGVALNKLSEAQSLKGRGDKAAAGKAFDEAIETFRKIQDKDRTYLLAQARIGECMVSSGRSDEGMKFLEAFLKKNAEYWADPNTPTRERQSWGWALLWIANAHDDLKHPDKVVSTLAGFEAQFDKANLDSSLARVRYLRVTALVELGKAEDAERECLAMLKENESSGWTTYASLRVANLLQSLGARAKAGGDRKASDDFRRRAVAFYEYWLQRSSDVGPDNYTFVGQIYEEVLGDHARAAELWTKALKLYEDAGNAEKAELLTVYLSSLLVAQGNYAEALPKFESLFVKTPSTIDPLREVFDRLKQKPSNIDAAVHEKQRKDILAKIAEAIALDPAVTNLASEARRAASTGDADLMVRAFSDTNETRKGLAQATAFTILGEIPSMIPELRVAVFELVKRQPDLMSNLARCYDELWTTKPEYAIRALNLYSTLIESAKPAFVADEDTPGARYSERWFDWKYRMTRLYLNLGRKFTNEPTLKTVCGLVRAMETVNELEKADKARENLGKEFLALRDQADMELRKMGRQEGCK